MKSFHFFDCKTYLAAAINSNIEILEVVYESIERVTLKKKQVIENQIAVYDMKIKQVAKKGRLGFEGVEILVADIMKSFNVHFIRHEPRKEENNPRTFSIRQLDSMYPN